MKQVLRRCIVVLGLTLALAPLSAFADEQGNSDAIDAAKARQAWLQDMTPVQQGVVLGQGEIANAKAIAKMLSWDSHAQTRIPNTMQQYAQFCDAAIQHVQAQVANGTAMAMARPWDAHAQAEMANAIALSHALWDMIGDTYPGNPYKTVAPASAPLVSDDQALVATEDETAASTDEIVASDDALAADALGDDATD